MTSKTPTDLWVDAWMLSFEAASVVWLRSLRMMSGGAIAEREGQRMISEKITASAMFWPAMIWGGALSSPEAFGTKALAHYAVPIRANRRRLSRSAL
ncbi:hypothetical protein [Tsuneonella sp. HG222]